MKNSPKKYQQLRSELIFSCKQLDEYLGCTKSDFVIVPCEVNERHGTGILLKRIFSDSEGIISLRSHNVHGGRQDFGEYDVCLSHGGRSYSQILVDIYQQFKDKRPKRILSVPYFLDDFLSSIALKELFDVPMCTYIMDDQNIYDHSIPDDVIKLFLEKSDLRLGIGTELCEAYENKYGLKFWTVPPVVEEKFIQKAIQSPSQNLQSERHGILIGNIWRQSWLDNLRCLIKASSSKIDWYGKPNRDWLSFQDDELAADGIMLKGFFEPFSPEEEKLIELLRTFPYAIIPSAGYEDEGQELARLSLPSRIPFIVATSNVPVIILGRNDSAAANFVERFGLGVTCDYDCASFSQAVDFVCDPQNQMQIRQRGAELSSLFKADDLADWLWRSLAAKEPIDLRFKQLYPSQNNQKFAIKEEDSANYKPKLNMENADVVITLSEVNQKHGTGTLLKRLFADNSRVLSIRSIDQYGGQHGFGLKSIVLSHLNRIEAFKNVANLLDGSTIRHIFCIPYSANELLTAIAVRSLFKVPMAAYIMDDQNIAVNTIPDALMQEFLENCDLRLAISPELKDAYEQKYGLKFWLLPAIAPNWLISRVIEKADDEFIQARKGCLVGSLWSEAWFNLLRQTIGNHGITLDWFGNTDSLWLKQTPQELEQQGIVAKGLIAEESLVAHLRHYPYLVVPTGTLDERDDLQAVSQFSLPSRIVFALATANIPMIVVGSPNTAAANFVKRFDIGVVCDYSIESFQKAVEHICEPKIQQEMRQNALKIAKTFSDRGLTEWLERSLSLGQPIDLRFEALLPRSPSSLVHFIEPPSPSEIYRDFVPVYEVVRRLKNQGFTPDFVLDVGASSGIWSHTAGLIFLESRFILIDPLMSKYGEQARDYYLKRTPNPTFLECAISNQAGKTTFQVSPDLYGSSLLNPADFRTYESIEVTIRTLDEIAQDQKLSGRGMLKIDVQCAEHLVLEGATQLLSLIDVIIIELSFVRYDPNALVFAEMLELLTSLGFRYYDETGDWRSPIDGTLLQKEIVFLRNDLLVPTTSQDIT